MCLDNLRRRQRDRHTEIEECHISFEMAEEDNLTALVGRVIASLPDREREVIHLHDVEGMAFEDIAEVVGSSVEAVRMACSRARQKVKEQLIKFMNYGV
jgi:RNA polymerase sigma-70 factor (ECF subfamily)